MLWTLVKFIRIKTFSVANQRRQERQPRDEDHDVEEVVGLQGLVRAAPEPLVLRPDLLFHRVR